MKNRNLLLICSLFSLAGLWADENQAGTMPGRRKSSRPTEGRPGVRRDGAQPGHLHASTTGYKYTKFIEDWQFTLTWKDQKRKFFTSEGLRLDSNNMQPQLDPRLVRGAVLQLGAHQPLQPLRLFPVLFGRLAFLGVCRRMARDRLDQRPWSSPRPAARPSASPCSRSPTISAAVPASPTASPASWSIRSWGSTMSWTAGAAARAFPTAGWNDFRVSLGDKHGPASPAAGNSGHAALDLDLRLVTLPGYGLPGSGSGYSRRPIDNGYRDRGPASTARLVEEFFARTRSVISGWWWKDVRADESGGLRGCECWLGPVMGWDLFQKKAGRPLRRQRPGHDRSLARARAADPLHRQALRRST